MVPARTTMQEPRQCPSQVKRMFDGRLRRADFLIKSVHNLAIVKPKENMSDITIGFGDVFINIRVGGLIRNNGQILLCQIPGSSYWFLPGGRIKTNESSYEALARELLEELGSGFKVNNLQISSENYFSSDNRKYHEIAFYYSVSWDGSPIISKGKESFIWINENEIFEYDIRPSFIKEYVGNDKTEIIHIIHRDM